MWIFFRRTGLTNRINQSINRLNYLDNVWRMSGRKCCEMHSINQSIKWIIWTTCVECTDENAVKCTQSINQSTELSVQRVSNVRTKMLWNAPNQSINQSTELSVQRVSNVRTQMLQEAWKKVNKATLHPLILHALPSIKLHLRKKEPVARAQ